MTSKEEAMIIQSLFDYMSDKWYEDGYVISVSEMYEYLLVGYDVMYEDSYLEELRMIFVEDILEELEDKEV